MIVLDEDKGPPWIRVEFGDEWNFYLNSWRLEYCYEIIGHAKTRRLHKMGVVLIGPLAITYGSGASQLVQQ